MIPDSHFTSALSAAKAEVRATATPAVETVKDRANRLTVELVDALEASEHTALIKGFGHRQWGEFNRLEFSCKHYHGKSPLEDAPAGTLRHFALPAEGWELLEELVQQRGLWLIADEKTRLRQDPERLTGYAVSELGLVVWTLALLGQRSEPKDGQSVLVMQGADWFDELISQLRKTDACPATTLEQALAAVPYEAALCGQAHPTAECWVNPKRVGAYADTCAEGLIRREEATAFANDL